MLGQLEEFSIFSMVNGFTTISHQYQLNVLGKQRDYTASFNDGKPYIAAIDDSKKGDFKLTSPHQLFSDLSYQVAFRQALLNNPDLQAIDFHIAKNKGTVKHYTFNKTEEGVTDTSLGKLAVTKFSYYKSKNEFIEFWLAKDYAYLPVYVQNVEGGKTLYKLSIDELSYGGKAIHAGEEVSLN